MEYKVVFVNWGLVIYGSLIAICTFMRSFVVSSNIVSTAMRDIIQDFLTSLRPTTELYDDGQACNRDRP